MDIFSLSNLSNCYKVNGDPVWRKLAFSTFFQAVEDEEETGDDKKRC